MTVDTAGSGVVSHAGAVLLIETIRTLGLDRVLSCALARWRRPVAVHDPAKVLLDLAVATAVGGDCLADIAVLRLGVDHEERCPDLRGYGLLRSLFARIEEHLSGG